MPETLIVPIFPLGTVLFPDGLLPLKLFEQRYLDMAKGCLRPDQAALPFGVCLIQEGQEVGKTAVPSAVGCLAHITSWDMPTFGVLHVKTRGGKRFRLIEQTTEKNGLIRAHIELIAPDVPTPLPDHLSGCATLLTALIKKAPTYFSDPPQLNDAGWVANRLAELLPIPTLARLKLMELDDPEARLEIMGHFLAQKGLQQSDD